MTETWTPSPTRGYSWPPFEKGNVAAMTHGAASSRMIEPLARRIAAELADCAPWTSRPTYAATIAAWSWAEAKAHLLRSWLDEHGLVDDNGVPRPAAAMLEKVETRAANLRGELGLSPLALARLLNAFTSAPTGVDDDGLDALKAEGRRYVEAHTAASAQDVGPITPGPDRSDPSPAAD